MIYKKLPLLQRFTVTVNKIAVITALALFLLPNVSSAEVRVIDHVVAVVDDDIIMQSELDERIEQVQYNIKSKARPIPDVETLKTQVLNTMILENLQLQMGQRAGVRISDQQLNQALSRIAAQNGMTLPEFRKALAKDGLDYNATREQIRREMILQQVQAGNINNKIQITDKEVENFLNSKEGSSLTAVQYHLAHLFYPLNKGQDKAQAIALLTQAEKAIRGGETLDDWKKANANNGLIQGGDLGWRSSSDLPSVFADIAPTLNPGEISPPFVSDNGVHLVELIAKRGGSQMVQQTKVRHILLKTSAIRDNQQAETELEGIRQRIIDGADFAILAKEYSEDIGSASEGGELGWSNKGQFVPAFEKIMAATKIGDISQPFESQFGWHILQVEDRRMFDVSLEKQKNAARNYIHQRKFKDELDAWLVKIRNEAYVDIKS